MALGVSVRVSAALASLSLGAWSLDRHTTFTVKNEGTQPNLRHRDVCGGSVRAWCQRLEPCVSSGSMRKISNLRAKLSHARL